MARNEQDPAASTQQFRAFATSGEPAGRQSSNTTAIIAAVVGVVLVIAIVVMVLAH